MDDGKTRFTMFNSGGKVTGHSYFYNLGLAFRWNRIDFNELLWKNVSSNKPLTNFYRKKLYELETSETV